MVAVSKIENRNNTTGSKFSFINSDKLACLKEEIIQIDSRKEGKGKFASAFYTYKEWGRYYNYAFKSDESINRANKSAKIGAFIGTIGAGVMSSEEMVLSGFIAGAITGVLVSHIFLYPKMIKEFIAIKREIKEAPENKLG